VHVVSLSNEIMNDLNICYVNDCCLTQILIIETFDYDLYEIKCVSTYGF